MVVQLRLLRALRPFDQFSEEILTRAAQLFTYREYPTSNTLVAREGAADATVHILTQGEVRLSAISIHTPTHTTTPPTSTHLHLPATAARCLPKQVRLFTVGAGGVEVDLGYVKSSDAKPCGGMVGKRAGAVLAGGATEERGHGWPSWRCHGEAVALAAGRAPRIPRASLRHDDHAQVGGRDGGAGQHAANGVDHDDGAGAGARADAAELRRAARARALPGRGVPGALARAASTRTFPAVTF